MPYIRWLPSGKSQATVRAPDGTRHSTTDPLRRVVATWARDREAEIARGVFRDPRLGQIKVGDWYARVSKARGIEDVTKAKNASLWRNHCKAEWARWPMAAITRLEAQAWVDRLRAAPAGRYGKPAAPGDEPLGAESVAAIAHLMSSLYRLAMKESPPLVTVNPFGDLELPRIEPKPVQFYEHDEAGQLYEAAGEYRTLIEFGMNVGLRWGELAGLHGHRVDWLRGRVAVVDVMTPYGLRAYPKSRKSHRVVPVPGHLIEAMSVLMTGRPLDALVFTAPEGGPLNDSHFRKRTWHPAITQAGIRRFPPRIMRHTAASWLVQDGVPLYDVQALLGHEHYGTTERYAHLAPGAHSRVLDSWARRLDAPVTHDRKEAHPH